MSSVNGYFLPSYQVSCRDFATPALLAGCVGLPWARNHWQLANTDTDRSLGHRIIAALEALPIFGALAVLVERIASAIISHFQSQPTDPNYLFCARRVGRSQEGCRGSFNIERAEVMQRGLQATAPRGISFDPEIIRRSTGILGTCTAFSLKFATTYFRLRGGSDPGSEPYLNALRQEGQNFERSSEEMRSRQIAYSSITVDRNVEMDVSKNKVVAYIRSHNFETDHCSRELDLTTNSGSLRQEIDSLPHGVYFVRMLKPHLDNHKLEARGHSMVYVHEERVGLFYDPNWGLEKMTRASGSTDGALLSERLLSVHNEWDIPMIRFYRLQQPENPLDPFR